MPTKISADTLVRQVGKRMRAGPMDDSVIGMLRVKSVGTELVFRVGTRQLKPGSMVTFGKMHTVANAGMRRREFELRNYTFTGSRN